jgi:phage FluMu protein Com
MFNCIVLSSSVNVKCPRRKETNAMKLLCRSICFTYRSPRDRWKKKSLLPVGFFRILERFTMLV